MSASRSSSWRTRTALGLSNRVPLVEIITGSIIRGGFGPWRRKCTSTRMTRGSEMRGKNILDRPCREMIMEASGDELLEPIIDGEYYRNVKRLAFHIGPRVRIPKIVARKAAAA